MVPSFSSNFKGRIITWTGSFAVLSMGFVGFFFTSALIEAMRGNVIPLILFTAMFIRVKEAEVLEEQAANASMNSDGDSGGNSDYGSEYGSDSNS